MILTDSSRQFCVTSLVVHIYALTEIVNSALSCRDSFLSHALLFYPYTNFSLYCIASIISNCLSQWVLVLVPLSLPIISWDCSIRPQMVCRTGCKWWFLLRPALTIWVVYSAFPNILWHVFLVNEMVPRAKLNLFVRCWGGWGGLDTPSLQLIKFKRCWVWLENLIGLCLDKVVNSLKNGYISGKPLHPRKYENSMHLQSPK